MGVTCKNIKKILLVITLCSNSSVAANTNSVHYKTIEPAVQNETEQNVLFHWEDYTVLAAMLLISCMIGIYYGQFEKKQVTGDDFLLGGSTIGTFPMALSLTASFITAIELLGNPAEMYMCGVQFWMTCTAFLLVVPIASQLYLPVFMKLRLTSCYEYLEMRFCKSVRLYASTLYLLQMIMYTAVCVYAPALALSAVIGLNVYVSVSIVYLVCIFYGSLGGMKAVIMTDTFQLAVFIGSLVTVMALSAIQAGGFSVVWQYASETNRLHFFDMNPDPTVRHSFWSVVIGGTMYWLSMFCANQASVQKYMSVQNIEQVRIALWVSAFGLITIYTINFITGASLALYYSDCDPLQAGMIDASDRILPFYVVNHLGKMYGMAGFFVAGVFAASLGTVASELNSLSAIICQDLVVALFEIEIPKHREAFVARCIGALCGVVSFGLVFVVERLGPVLQLALSLNGMAGGIALGLFTLGMFIPWANSKGAIAGGIIGLLLVAIAGGGAELSQLHIHRLPASIDGCGASYNKTLNSTTDPNEFHDEAVFWLFRVSYLWYTGLGCSATIAAGILVSAFTGPLDPAVVPIDLLSPPIVKLLHSFQKKSKSGYICLD